MKKNSGPLIVVSVIAGYLLLDNIRIRRSSRKVIRLAKFANEQSSLYIEVIQDISKNFEGTITIKEDLVNRMKFLSITGKDQIENILKD